MIKQLRLKGITGGLEEEAEALTDRLIGRRKTKLINSSLGLVSLAGTKKMFHINYGEKIIEQEIQSMCGEQVEQV